VETTHTTLRTALASGVSGPECDGVAEPELVGVDPAMWGMSMTFGMRG